MAQLTRKEFAELTGISDKHIPTYVKRGKLVLMANGNLNTANSLNKFFIASKNGTAKKPLKKKSLKKAVSKESVEKKVADDKPDAGYMAIIEANKRKLDLEISIKEEDLLKRRLDNEKKRGETMPTEFVKDLIKSYGFATRKAYKDSTETIILLIGHEAKLSNEQTTKIRKQLNSVLNKAVDEASDIAISTVKAIVKEYSQTRGVGESR